MVDALKETLAVQVVQMCSQSLSQIDGNINTFYFIYFISPYILSLSDQRNEHNSVLAEPQYKKIIKVSFEEIDPRLMIPSRTMNEELKITE